MNIAQNIGNSVGSKFNRNIAADKSIPSNDVGKYLLAISDFRKGIQDEIKLYVMRDRLNNASFRQESSTQYRKFFCKDKTSSSLYLKIFLRLILKTQ